MRRIAALAVCIALGTAGAASAAVGGGDIIMKNKGGDVVFSHDTHVEGMSLTC